MTFTFLVQSSFVLWGLLIFVNRVNRCSGALCYRPQTKARNANFWYKTRKYYYLTCICKIYRYRSSIPVEQGRLFERRRSINVCKAIYKSTFTWSKVFVWINTIVTIKNSSSQITFIIIGAFFAKFLTILRHIRVTRFVLRMKSSTNSAISCSENQYRHPSKQLYFWYFLCMLSNFTCC